MATWQDVHRLALALPEVALRAPRDWRVKDKLVVWERPLRKSDLAALGTAAPRGAILGAWVPDLDIKEARLAARPDLFFTTPHFDGYPVVLVRLAAIGKKDFAGADRRGVARPCPETAGEGVPGGKRRRVRPRARRRRRAASRPACSARWTPCRFAPACAFSRSAAVPVPRLARLPAGSRRAGMCSPSIDRSVPSSRPARPALR